MFSSHRRPVMSGGAVIVASALLLVGLAPPAGAADPRSSSVATKAIAFVASQQRDDGGFGSGEDGFPGFETPDAVLAIADAAQTDLDYNAAAAFRSVRAIRKNGRDGLGYLDDLVDGGVDAGKAAQLIVVAKAVGLDPTKFDPDGDGAADLVAQVDASRNSD